MNEVKPEPETKEELREIATEVTPLKAPRLMRLTRSQNILRIMVGYFVMLIAVDVFGVADYCWLE